VIKHSSNYRGISLSLTTYKTLSNILLSRLTPYAKEIIGKLQCGLQGNRFTTDHILWICQILEKKWEYNEAVYQLLTSRKLMIQLVGRSGIIFSLSLVSP